MADASASLDQLPGVHGATGLPSVSGIPDGPAEPIAPAGQPAAVSQVRTNRQQPPAQTILRLRFRRGGPATWLAHLDLMRTFERAVKRAGLPVQWSAGFNPRPDLVFALPIGVGLETCADYVDIGLAPGTVPGAAESANQADPAARASLAAEAAALGERLAAVLPEGIGIVSAKLQPAEKESIMGRIAFADYLIEAKGLSDAAGRALEASTLIIDKPSKGRTLRVDIRPLILQTRFDAPDQLRLRVRAGSRENLRPDLFLQALVAAGGLDPTAAADARIVRTGLYLSAQDAAARPADPEGGLMPAEPAACA